jgi:trk system potassium uptake protein TrkA
MHVVIGGFGRVGRFLAHALEDEGHSIAVIDRDESVFAEYGEELRGLRISGEVFDRQTMIRAGIERADAYVAVTSGDNSNIVSARVAKERFGVQRVVARIFDPRRAAIYERFNIASISSVRWAAGQLLARLLDSELQMHCVYGSGEMLTIEAPVPPELIGKRIADIDVAGKFAVTVIVRDGRPTLPEPTTAVAAGDVLYVTCASESIAELKELLGRHEVTS